METRFRMEKTAKWSWGSHNSKRTAVLDLLKKLFRNFGETCEDSGIKREGKQPDGDSQLNASKRGYWDV